MPICPPQGNGLKMTQEASDNDITVIKLMVQECRSSASADDSLSNLDSSSH